jgi:hypothetical protein
MADAMSIERSIMAPEDARKTPEIKRWDRFRCVYPE